MSVFDTLAEQRYQDWLEKVSAPDYQPPPVVARTASRKSYEAHVFSEVLRYLDQAAEAVTPEEQRQALEKAQQLEVQLIILLERRNMPHAVLTLRASIDRHRQRVLERASRTPSNASAKPAS